MNRVRNANSSADRNRGLERVGAVATAIGLVGGVGAGAIAVGLAASHYDGASATTPADSGNLHQNQNGDDGNGSSVAPGQQQSVPQGQSHGS